MHNEWINKGAPLDLEDLPHGRLAERITRQSVDGLGGHSDHLAGAQGVRAALEVHLGGREDLAESGHFRMFESFCLPVVVMSKRFLLARSELALARSTVELATPQLDRRDWRRIATLQSNKKSLSGKEKD